MVDFHLTKWYFNMVSYGNLRVLFTPLKSKKITFLNMWLFNWPTILLRTIRAAFPLSLVIQMCTDPQTKGVKEFRQWFWSFEWGMKDEASLMKAAYQLRPPVLLAADWLTRGGRGCRDSKDVRAHLKTCCSQIHSLAPNTRRFNVGTGDDAVLKQGSYKGKKRTPRQEPDFSLLSG